MGPWSGRSHWPWGLWAPAHPTDLARWRRCANPDPCQLPVMSQQHRRQHIPSDWCQLEREFPQDQREGLPKGGGWSRLCSLGAGAHPFPLTLPSLSTHRKMRNPSQNRKAKDASDNGKGQPQGSPPAPAPTPSLASWSLVPTDGCSPALNIPPRASCWALALRGSGPADWEDMAAALHA